MLTSLVNYQKGAQDDLEKVQKCTAR